METFSHDLILSFSVSLLVEVFEDGKDGEEIFHVFARYRVDQEWGRRAFISRSCGT